MKLSVKTLAMTVPLAGLLSLSMPASAVPFAIEGPILSIEPSAAGTQVLVSCMGKKVVVDATTAVKTPVRKITLSELADVTPFPFPGVSPVTGAPRQGFVGGTCILNADDARKVTFSDSVSYPVASSMLVEVAENVLVGAGQFTRDANDPAKPGPNSQILGVPVSTIDDLRMKTSRYAAGMHILEPMGVTRTSPNYDPKPEYVRNAFGFGVDPQTIPPGDTLTAGGHLGSDPNRTLYAHTIESTDGTLLITVPRPSIQRAQCLALPGAIPNSFVSTYTIRGGCVLPGNGASALVRLIAVNPGGENVEIGTTQCIRKVAAGGLNRTVSLGLYTYAGRNIAGRCPGSIAATFGQVPRGSILPNSNPVWADVVTPDLR